MRSFQVCRLALFCALLVGNISTPSFAAEPREVYASPRGKCDGYPRLDIGTVPGMCAGLVIGPTREDRTRKVALPRSLVQLDDSNWLVSDLGAWDRPAGAIWRLQGRAGEVSSLTALVTGLNLPHALAMGTDGLVYVGEMSRIIRFDPKAAYPAKTVEVIISNLPDNKLHLHRHPLSKFVFAPDGALLVNVGAPSDQCVDSRGRASGISCAESEAGEQTASIRRYAKVGPGKWNQNYTVHARGLRNSVALSVHPSGTIVQAENSYDFTTRWFPFEEVNVIEPNRHYGWPYCADLHTPTPAWKSRGAMDCKSAAHTRPVVLLPPHAAPLDLLWYQGSMFPALKGRMLMTWHGHRSTGGRIASFAVDARGVPIPDKRASFPVYGAKSRAYGAGPAATPVVLTPQWGLLRNRRPQGSPVGLAVARDGAIWTTDDRAGLVIRLATDRD
jgi:glucose/arabinose dehydrogenase